jgi:hypothetical protein
MRMSAMPFALGTLLLLCFSCKDRSIAPSGQPIVSFSSQYSKCLGGLAKSSTLDSVFTYSFSDTLLIDFSAISNCCPDSDRFDVSSTVGSDTIVVSVADTAQHLCRCVCPYMVEARFANLPNDHYLVRCRISSAQDSTDPIHLVDVYRRN